MPRLTTEEKEEIKKLEGSMSIRELAFNFGVHKNTIRYHLGLTKQRKRTYNSSKYKEWFARTRDQRRAYHLKWRKAHPDLIKRQREKYEANRSHEAIQKARVRARLRYAVRTGKMQQGPCIICGSNEVEGHHTDYDKPYDVQWLCKKHHWDVEMGKLQLAAAAN